MTFWDNLISKRDGKFNNGTNKHWQHKETFIELHSGSAICANTSRKWMVKTSIICGPVCTLTGVYYKDIVRLIIQLQEINFIFILVTWKQLRKVSLQEMQI